MMKEEDKLKHKFGTDTGFRVPDNYFDSVFSEIEAKLPDHPGLKTPAKLPRWQKLKPYVYLAAMFGGIWCTMKMVSMMSETQNEQVSLDNPPEMIAQAMSSPEVMSQVCSSPSVMVVEEEVYADEPALISGSIADSTEEMPKEESTESADEYSEFVSISDIDLGQLRAALDKDDPVDEYYYYYI